MSGPAPATPSWKRIARRLARPLLAPIDGRVEDINRRTDNARVLAHEDLARIAERLEQTIAQLDARAAQLMQAMNEIEWRTATRVDALSGRVEQAHAALDRYADAAIESSQLTTHELRRLDDSVRTLEQRLDELQHSATVRTQPRIRAAE